MMSLQETFNSAKDGSGVPAHQKQNTRSSSIIKKKKTKPTKMKYHSYAPPYHPSLQSSTNTTHAAQHQLTKKLQPLQLPTLQSNYINAKMNELRNLAVASATNKRQKKVDDHQRTAVVESVITPSHNCNSITSNSDGFDMLEELDGQPNVVQIVATSGGMITHCK